MDTKYFDYDVLPLEGDEKHVLHVAVTDEGIIIDLYNESGDVLGTWAHTAQELADILYGDES